MHEKALDLDSYAVRDFARYQTLRLWMAGALTLFLAAGGLALIFLDKAVYGFVLLVAEIAGLMAVFLALRVSDDEDLEIPDDEDLESLLAELDQGDEV